MRKLVSSFIFFCSAAAFAAEPSVTFDVQPRVIHLGESATASVRFHNMQNPAQPGTPQIDGFDVQSVSQNINSTADGNGRQELTVSFDYTIVSRRAGKFVIRPYNELPGVTVEVVGTDGAPQSGQEQLFAKLEPSSTNLYVQQIFDLTLKIYVSTKLNLHGIGPLQNLPAQGLVVHQPQQLDTQREVINGEVYNVYRFSLKAQSVTAGRYDLAPVQRAELVGQRRRRDPFEDFGIIFGGVPTEPRDITLQPLTLIIKDLPAEGRPASFAGAVGQFTFDMTAKPADLTAGDPITLNFRITGHGNLDGVQMPVLALGDQFKTYDPKLTSQNFNEQTASGDKTFEQVIIPKSDAAKMISEVVFSYFDPDKSAYQTIQRGPVQLAVHAASKDKASLLVENSGTPVAASQKAELLGSDIVYLKPAPREWMSVDDRAWYAHPATMAAQAVPALAVAATFLLVRRREKLLGDVAASRRQLAPKAARTGIARARSAIAANDAKQFYESLWSAMSSYFGNRLNLAPGDVSSARVDAAFASAKFDGPQRQLVKNLFSTCEQARFGGAAAINATGAEKQIAELEDALRACEKIKI